MKRALLPVLLFSFIPFISFAQKKTFTYQQLFKGAFPSVFRSVPEIEGWLDDHHYIEVRKDDAGRKTTLSVDVRTGKSIPYLKLPETEILPFIPDAQNITLSPDKKYAAYTRKNNLFVLHIAAGKETALSSDGSDTILNGYASWIYYEEILGRASHYKAFWWSPDSKHIAYMRFDDSKVPVFPIYFAEGQHGHLENQHYPKVGDANPEVKIGITSITTPHTVWADFDPAHDQYFGTPAWSPVNELWIQWMNRSQDSLILYKVNHTGGNKIIMYQETQSTWITLDIDSRLHFLSNDVIVKSDKDGWDNLYLLSNKKINPITRGNFWGTSILYADEKNKILYIKARKENSARFDLYKVSFDGKKTTRLSFGNYSHDNISMSPGGKYFITTYSNLSTPPHMALADHNGKIIRELANSEGAEFNDYALPTTKLSTVRSSDGLFDLPLTITYPIHFDPSKKYPVWISIYGGPNDSKVYDRWKNNVYTIWWAQEGVVQVVMDNRSSGHFGRKGMNYIFRQLGKYEVEDFMDCGRWLRAQSWADSTKIGITGGSFGGYITCLALTYGADVFTHGIANYSVSDWKLYDTHYTEKYMRTPKENPEGYKNSSVLSYVNKYRGMLRIVHGTTDDNVHLQNSIQLIDTLEDLNKDFELMLYPGQRHGIDATKAAHYQAETSKFMYRYLLNKELPDEFRK